MVIIIRVCLLVVMINFLKFFHLIFALGLLGSVFICMISIDSKNKIFNRFNQFILLLAFLAMITGTFLVHPKNYTFYTPWIQAAYLLIFIFSFIVLLLLFLRKKFGQIPRVLELFIYLLLVVLLLFVIHDAVTKTTFLF